VALSRPNLTVYFGVRYSRFGTSRTIEMDGFQISILHFTHSPVLLWLLARAIAFAGSGNFCNGLFVNSQNPKTATKLHTGILSLWR